jgi:hypothetical protein
MLLCRVSRKVGHFVYSGSPHFDNELPFLCFRSGDRTPRPVLGAAVFAALLRQLHPARDDDHSGTERVSALQGQEPGGQGRVVDPQTGPAHPDGRNTDVHERPALPVLALGRFRRVDAQNQLAASSGHRYLRVSSEHRAQDQPSLPPECRG